MEEVNLELGLRAFGRDQEERCVTKNIHHLKLVWNIF